MNLPRFASGLLVLASCASLTPPARAQLDPPGIDPTHYWSYHLVPAQFFPTPVRVRDVFMAAPAIVELDSLQRLANWASKDNAPVADTTKRYTWWHLRDPLPNSKSGVITNQRGDFAVELYEARFLLVPASKYLPWTPPASGNPYLCYRAQALRPTGTYHAFRDEWRVDFLLLEDLEYVCVPCELEYGGVTHPLVDPAAYLSVYAVAPRSGLFATSIADPLLAGSRSVRQLLPNEHVMLPSVFQLQTPARSGSWGRLKTIYR